MDSEPYSIHAEGVWQTTNSTPDVVVAVLDTGLAEQAKTRAPCHGPTGVQHRQ